MSKITSNVFNNNFRSQMITSYKERMAKSQSLVNRTSGDIIGHRYKQPAPVRRSIVPNEKSRSRITKELRHVDSGDIIFHRDISRDNKRRKEAFNARRKRLKEVYGPLQGRTSGDIVGHRDTRGILSRKRPRSARKVRPSYTISRNGDIVSHKDANRFKTRPVFGRRPASARKSRVKISSGDIISHNDRNKFKVSYKVGKKMVDSPQYMKKNGGKKMGYGKKATLHGVVPKKGFTVFKRSPRPKRAKKKRETVFKRLSRPQKRHRNQM